MIALMAVMVFVPKTFGKSERAYQGGRLDKPHKFPGNVGRMTSSRRSSRGVDSGPRKTQQEDKHKCTHTASMNYHPSLISLSTEELPKAWLASQEKENFSMYAWDPPPSSRIGKIFYKGISTLCWVYYYVGDLGTSLLVSQREFFFTPKVSNPSRGNDKGDHTVALPCL